MEKIQVSEEFKNDYMNLIRTSQNIELAIGGAYVKLSKMTDMRKQVDADLKTWWDKIAEEYKIDKSKDYFVDADGAINVVEKSEAPDVDDVDPDAIPTAPKAPADATEDNKEGGSTADLT